MICELVPWEDLPWGRPVPNAAGYLLSVPDHCLTHWTYYCYYSISSSKTCTVLTMWATMIHELPSRKPVPTASGYLLSVSCQNHIVPESYNIISALTFECYKMIFALTFEWWSPLWRSSATRWSPLWRVTIINQSRDDLRWWSVSNLRVLKVLSATRYTEHWGALWRVITMIDHDLRVPPLHEPTRRRLRIGSIAVCWG
jgi:hypothetical protein